MDLDFDKYCVIDGSPTTVLPAPRCKSNRKSIKEEFSDISFNRYRSASCRDARSRKSDHGHNEVLKRGSVYQSSKEMSLLKKSDPIVGRKKIEFSRESASALSFGIIDSLCTLDEEDSYSEVRSSVMSLSEESTSCKYETKLGARKTINRSFPPIPKRVVSPNVCSSDRSENQEKKVAFNLHKSLSAKLSLPHSPSHSESDSFKTSSPISCFSPVGKRFDPFVKSKSERSPLSSANEDEEKKTIHKSMVHNLLEKAHHGKCEKKEKLNLVGQHSPAHLQAFLKLENRHGLPYFEFSVDSLEDLYVVKTWKVENVLTWVYTFHSVHSRRKNNSSIWGFKESNREAAVLGQMNVSCYPCMELKGGGTFEESMVTEFVYYDVSHLRKCTFSQENSPNNVKGSDESFSWSNCERSENSPKTKIKGQSRSSRNFGYTGSLPLTSTELHPEHESASIVIQIPFEKRESLKLKNGDENKSFSNFHDIFQRGELFCDEAPCPGKMHVVIPAGNHSLPNNESCSPSSLVDRWRLGGGCDCGGWDMACPLDVFGNPNVRIAQGHPLMDNQHPAKLFAQGKKERLPAFTMRAVEEGKYSVDFHAQLSSLQAFSICVAILHVSESSNAVGHDRSKQMLQSESLRVFPEEQIGSLMEAITEEEKRAVNKKKIGESLPTFVINPPFSPIARV